MQPTALVRVIISWMLLSVPLLGTAEMDGIPEPDQERLLTNARQLTFAGKRSGEGYFSQDGSRLVFQGEREPDNPFFQIYVMDLQTGDVRRVSPGYGKTTCAWFQPLDKGILFASTHEDGEARSKQKAELRFRASGKKRRYSWDYDEHYDLFIGNAGNEVPVNITQTPGYDAEGSFSPDGKLIAFASNRHAYTDSLSAADATRFKRDPSYLMDIYVMNSDGTNVRRLTTTNGYDGGPFFSADGATIVWRRFAPDGHSAEIFTMAVDGSKQRQITRMGAMSWAPFFHPSGDYIIFGTNVQGHGNIELYLVDAEGKRDPVRVTFNDGFDGLAAFRPDGQELAWTSNQSSTGSSQIFLAEWDDAAARRLLSLSPLEIPVDLAPDPGHGLRQTAEIERSPAIAAADVRAHVEELTSEAMGGRLTGTIGEKHATQYVASVFQLLGLDPAGDDGGYFQRFEFTSGVSLGQQNRLTLHNTHTEAVTGYVSDQVWRPLGFSKTGDFPSAPVVFAGYGIIAPATKDKPGYDSYRNLEVKDKWVLVLRDLPREVTLDYRQHLSRYASLRHKAMVARDRGARGLLAVNGPKSRFKDHLVPLTFDMTAAQFGVAALTVAREVAMDLLEPSDRTLPELEDALANGDTVPGFEIPRQRLAAAVDMAHQKRSGRNVLARLRQNGQDNETAPGSSVVIGAHVDHIGDGRGTGSLGKEGERGRVHHGADDNASGVAAMLEIAAEMSARKMQGALTLGRDVLFAAWSGEELGSLGASHFVAKLAAVEDSEPENRAVSAYLNMDMIGRLDGSLAVQGMGSSSDWASKVEWANVPVGLSIVTQAGTYLPTDSTAFYLKGVPILNAFTGSHPEYHTPRDTAEKLNYSGVVKIARLFGRLAELLANTANAPVYAATQRPSTSLKRGKLRASLGTIPDYTWRGGVGVRLFGVSSAGPAARAGLRENDIITELAGRRVENLYDYTEAIGAVKIGEPIAIVVTRGTETVKLEITPESRE